MINAGKDVGSLKALLALLKSLFSRVKSLFGRGKFLMEKAESHVA